MDTARYTAIQQYYAGKTIFVTGATGFVGQVLIEKLLRSCPGIKKIYILLRAKKNKSAQDRFKEYFSDPLFDTIKQKYCQSMDKLSIITGDLSLMNLGLSDEDLHTIITEVNCVFHSAATISFNEKVKPTLQMNTRASYDLLNIAKRMINLQSFVYVSTAYSFSNTNNIDEKVYEIPIDAETLCTMLDKVSEDKLENVVSILSEGWPNTYTFSKAIAESMFVENTNNLPIAVVRPSIIMGTANEPKTGWLGRLQGGNVLLLAMYLNMIHVLNINKKDCTDIIPVDYVSNSIIVAGWDIGTRRNAGNEVPIYNQVSYQSNPITWEEAITHTEKFNERCPSLKKFWHGFFIPSSNVLLLRLHYFLHLLLAYIINIFSFKKGSKAVLMTKKMDTFISVTTPVNKKEWKFKGDNVPKLWDKLSEEDKSLFNFDLKSLNWETFFNESLMQIRLNILNDPIETVSKAKIRAQFLKLLHYTLIFCFTYLITNTMLYIFKMSVTHIY